MWFLTDMTMSIHMTMDTAMAATAVGTVDVREIVRKKS